MFAAASAKALGASLVVLTLIREAMRLIGEQGDEAAFLIPSEEWLHGFYAKYGFEGAVPVTFSSQDGFDFGTGDASKYRAMVWRRAPLRERGDDITLLFRKFASDFAEKYRMPAIQLTEDAKALLLAYPWPGNVRQLKNITEQISIIATNRDITAEILRNYLPEQRVNSGLPALFGVKASAGKAFESEREILYQVLFDMRRDVTELKKLVNTLMSERGAQPALSIRQRFI